MRNPFNRSDVLGADPDRAQPLTLPVAETFGPVYQGEGPWTGRRATFIRLGLCNLHCRWCDTPYTWDHTRFNIKQENPSTDVYDVVERVLATNPGIIVLTGGEPLIHQTTDAWLTMLRLLDPNPIHVETNGTIIPTSETQAAVDFFSVSPKLSNGGDVEHRRLQPAPLRTFTELATRGKAAFKFVCETSLDVAEVSAVVDRYGIPRRVVWVMPQGQEPDEVLGVAKRIEPAAHAQQFNLTLRQHVLLHGARRGV